MIETEISISVNRKTDIDIIEQKIIENKIQFPVYIREYEFSYQINFTSDYEQWELDTKILNSFPGYEFTKYLEKGRKEIRIQISRYQSELSTDGWGRPIENPLDETKYLIKASVNKPEKFNPKVKVLFEDKAQHYFVNIVPGINKATEEKGFLLIDNFKSKNEDDNAEILKDKLYKSPLEAFHYSSFKMAEVVEDDFRVYLENKKKETREIQKLPRKIIRDFINACNSFDEAGLFKNLGEKFVYEQRINWKVTIQADGLDAFKKLLHSQDLRLCNKNFRIRSSWVFKLPRVTIGVKYYPTSSDTDKQPFQKYGQIEFLLEGNKIVGIIDES